MTRRTDLEEPVIPSRIRIVAVSLMAIALIAPTVGCSRASSSSGSGLSPAKRASGVDGASATASDAAAVKNADAEAIAAANGGGTGASTATDSNTNNTSGSGSSASPKPAPKPGTKPAPKPGVKPSTKPGMNVRIIFWNDTSSKPLKGTEIVAVGMSYKPSTGKTDTGSIGTVPYGEVVKLVVYPDGRSGKSVTVPFTVLKGMIADSEQDAIHVAISDGSVRVLGNAVDNFDQTLPRF